MRDLISAMMMFFFQLEFNKKAFTKNTLTRSSTFCGEEEEGE